MINQRENKFSLYTCYILTILMVVCFYANPKNSVHFFSREITFDMVSYYLYLPLAFMRHDIAIHDFSYIDYLMKTYEFSPSFYQAYQIDNGNWVMNYTCGFAIIYAPFFFIGHLWATLGGYPTDGFSFPYQFMIAHGLFLYILPGIYFLRKVLLRFFTDSVTAFTLLFLVLGTNYFHETFNDYIQPHAVLFTAYSILLYLTIRWHEKPSASIALLMGILMAWMILARPSEILCIIIPLCWNIYDKSSFLQKINLLRVNYRHLLLMIFGGLLIGLPQLIHWKVVTGKFLFYSYGQTEGFDFDGRYIKQVLFDFKKSWFVYTPIIVLPVLATFFMHKFNKAISLSVMLFLGLNFYLLSSWAAWWNGGSFGMRYFVESYAVIALPWGYLNQRILNSKLGIKLLLLVLMILLTLLNLFQTWQYVNWIIPPDRMTKAYYKAIFLKTKVDEKDRALMEVERSYALADVPFQPEGYVKKTIGLFNFDELNTSLINKSSLDSTTAYSGKFSQIVGGDFTYSATIRMPHKMITDKDHAWIHVSFYYKAQSKISEAPVSLVITYDHEGRKNYKYRGFDLEKLKGRDGEWNYFETYWMTPFPYDINDPLVIYLYSRGGRMNIDDLKIDAYQKE